MPNSYSETQGPRKRGGGGGGGHWGQVPPPHFFVPGEKVPFFGNESALFSWNRSAVLAKLKCPFWPVPPHFRGASAASAVRLCLTLATDVVVGEPDQSANYIQRLDRTGHNLRKNWPLLYYD